MTRSVFSSRYQQFRESLIHQRKLAGLTQSQLAAALGRPQSFVSKYERGERRLDVVEFMDIAEALNIDVGDFFNQLKHQQPKA